MISLLTAEEVNTSQVDSLEYRVHRVLSLLERDFPVSLRVIVFHSLHHLPMFIRHFGPSYGFWMYPMERFNSWVSRRVHNRRYPESTVLETYGLHEFSSFLQMCGLLPDGATMDIAEVNMEDDTIITASKESDTSGSDNSQGSVSRLDPTQWQEVDLFYRRVEPQYQNLCSRYEQEKKNAKKHHNLKQFPPLSLWTSQEDPPLTVTQLDLRKGPTDVISFHKMYTLKDKHGRSVKYGSVQSK